MSSSQRPTLAELEQGQIDSTDARTLALLADLYHSLDPVPAGLAERISFGITLDALHAEIAQSQRSGPLVGARSDEIAEAQTITFTSSHLTTMVTITALNSDEVRIDGWVAPGMAAEIELRLAEGSRRVVADTDGRFVFDGVPRGFAQFVIRPPDGRETPVVTPSIEL